MKVEIKFKGSSELQGGTVFWGAAPRGSGERWFKRPRGSELSLAESLIWRKGSTGLFLLRLREGTGSKGVGVLRGVTRDTGGPCDLVRIGVRCIAKKDFEEVQSNFELINILSCDQPSVHKGGEIDWSKHKERWERTLKEVEGDLKDAKRV